jgi:hypothetical protein
MLMDLASPPTRPAAPTQPEDRSSGVAASALRLAGTASLGSLPPDDPRLLALRRACALLEELEAERAALDRRLAEARRIDPMRQASGRTSLDHAAEETRRLVRELDEALCRAAESARGASATHPKDPR